MKYNAFISYKHAPEDNRVADAVHKGLERFHIPGKLRKKTGIKKINRIFRDKAELPITNDLSDNIADALENSDYLIVLCSTNTKESAWVPREIEAFLQNHTKRDIFTVLVNGEPRDVIPEILQYEERVVTAEDGSSQTVRIPIEPLSCDYRTSFRKAKKVELPRLAAGLIGCAYDEIMNRHRQYRLKVLAGIFSIAFAVVLGFAGYMFYSRNQIHKNYLESLKNQSKYLANESKNLFEKEQRITALQLALEALPKDDDDDRPITPEAVKALTDATLAYEGDDGVNIRAAWNYEMPNIVYDFKVSSDGNTVALLDAGSVVGVWDTTTHERKIYITDAAEKVRGIAFADDASLIVWMQKTMYCYDTGSGEKRWEVTLEGDSYEDGSTPVILSDSFYISTDHGKYVKYDTLSGEKKSEFSFEGEPGCEDFSVVESKPSPDKSMILFRGLIGYNNYAYGVVDIASGQVKISKPFSEMIKDIEWVDNSAFMVASTKVDNSSSMFFGDMELISTDHNSLRCINIPDLSEKWHADFTCNGVKINSDFVSLGKDTIGYYSGNVFTLYDVTTGEVKYSNNVNSSILDVSDRDGDGTPLYITEDGSYVRPALTVDKDAAYRTKYFTDELRQVIVNHGVYARKRSAREVICFSAGMYDKDWKALSENSFIAVNNESTGYGVIGSYKDRIYVKTDDVVSNCIKSAEISDDELKASEMFQFESSFADNFAMQNGILCYTDNKNNENLLVAYDVESGVKNERVLSLPENWTISKIISVATDGTLDGQYALSDGNEIIVYGNSGEEEKRLSCHELKPLGMMFMDEELMVLYNDGGLYRYLRGSGEVVNKTDVTVRSDNVLDKASFNLDKDSGLLFIQIGTRTSMIEMESFTQTAHIADSLGYLEGRDIFVTLAGELGKKKVGYYRRYTVDELIAKAHDILQNVTLSEAKRSRYGLDAGPSTQ